MNKELEVIANIYIAFLETGTASEIPVNLKPASVVGTVQDDPFDCWVEATLKKVLPSNYQIFHAVKLTTPDLIIRDSLTNTIIGLEIKKLIQRVDGKDPRGLTIDYNSCLPCGSTMIKVGNDTVIVPCYYLFALLNPFSTSIVTLILMDGDFLNYDFNLHKEAKYSNYTEYNHGPYGEGSVRYRKMYTYPNPLNSKLDCFAKRQLMVLKKSLVSRSYLKGHTVGEIIRRDKFDNEFYYSLVDMSSRSNIQNCDCNIIRDIFHDCKSRVIKERVAYIPEIPAL